jgi:TonB C terminal
MKRWPRSPKKERNKLLDYILTSGFVHAAILLGLCLSPEFQVARQVDRIEVNIVETPKSREQAPILQKSPTPDKPLKSLGSKYQSPKPLKIDLTSYANRLKAVVDPVWYGHVHGLENRLPRKLTTIVLLFPDKHGNVVSIRVIKPSGSSDLDQLAIQSFREVGQIPIPPDSLIKEGIEWEFSIGGGK